MRFFVLAMMQFPEVQRRAQEEIDRVVGTDRLPTFADRPYLPYVEAVLKETLRCAAQYDAAWHGVICVGTRWNPVLPAGVPHRTTDDDVYEGYFIPSGTIVFANQWSVTASRPGMRRTPYLHVCAIEVDVERSEGIPGTR